MAIAGAIQPRINKAIEDRLRADTDADPQESGTALEEKLRLIGAIVSPRIPLYWWRAPEAAVLPYIVYGPQDRGSDVSRTLCGGMLGADINYEVSLIIDAKDAATGIAVVDRLAVLLDGFTVQVESQNVHFYRDSEHCYPDFLGGEKGVTVTGLGYLCRVTG